MDGNKNVIYAEPDYYLPQIIETPEQIKPPLNSFLSWGVGRMNADKYADYLKKTGKTKQVTVAVVDTGVDDEHEFLSRRVLDKGYNFVIYNMNTHDDNGHGTLIPGTLVDCIKELNNIKILPVKVMDYIVSGTLLNVGNGVAYTIIQMRVLRGSIVLCVIF